MNGRPDISAIMTVHREGAIAGLSLRSLIEAATHATDRGITVEMLVAMDRPDTATKAVFADAAKLGIKVIEEDFGDQGQTRNRGVEESMGNFIAFLDGDDLWGVNWLSAAFEFCSTSGSKTIGHPQADWFFEGSKNTFIQTDQTDELFAPEFLRFDNYWDALCFAPRDAHEDFPYRTRELDKGFAFEDWRWNCETLEAGYVHRVVPKTIHFKRRRRHSQSLNAAKGDALVRPTELFNYRWP